MIEKLLAVILATIATFAGCQGDPPMLTDIPADDALTAEGLTNGAMKPLVELLRDHMANQTGVAISEIVGGSTAPTRGVMLVYEDSMDAVVDLDTIDSAGYGAGARIIVSALNPADQQIRITEAGNIGLGGRDEIIIGNAAGVLAVELILVPTDPVSWLVYRVASIGDTAPHGRAFFTSDDTWTCPVGVTSVRISAVGGGGGGGGGGGIDGSSPNGGNGSGGSDTTFGEALEVPSQVGLRGTGGGGGVGTASGTPPVPGGVASTDGGQHGQPYLSVIYTTPAGGRGATTIFGRYGRGGNGGAGAGGGGGAAGASGYTWDFDSTAVVPGTEYEITIGTGGGGGTAGVGATAGDDGEDGALLIEW